MPYKKINIEKIYYSIGEVANMLNVTPSVLRFWEKNFSIIKPYKNAKGKRYYTPKDINHLKYIFYLLRQKGFTIEGAKLYIKNKNQQKLNKEIIILSKLNALKEELLNIKNNLKDIENQMNTNNSDEQK